MGLPRTTGPMQSSVPPGSGGMVSGTGPAGPGFLGSQPQTVLMKQMLIDQRAQLMEQQKQQFLREQRQQQQQQQQILTEQVTHAYGGLPAIRKHFFRAWCLNESQVSSSSKKVTGQHFPRLQKSLQNVDLSIS